MPAFSTPSIEKDAKQPRIARPRARIREIEQNAKR